MKIAVLTSKTMYDKYTKPEMIPEGTQVEFIKNAIDLKAQKTDAQIALINSMMDFGPAEMDAMPNLKMICTEGVAFNKVNLQAAKDRNIFVCNARAANATQVAEHAIMLILTLVHRYDEGSAAMRGGKAGDIKKSFMGEGLKDLSMMKVGIVGFGAIGKELAKRLYPFGCQLYYYDPFPAKEEVEKALNVSSMGLDELLKECDIISLHLPVTEETKGLINKEKIALMKDSAIIINTSRGEIVNTADVAEAIKTGKLWGAGIDTFDPEPALPTDPLIALPEPYSYRVAISPHIGGTTVAAFQNMYNIFWNNVKALTEGKEPLTRV